MPGIVINADFYGERERLLQEAQKLSPEAIASILRDLNAAHDEVVARIARSVQGSYSYAQLAQTRQQIEQVMQEFARTSGQKVNQTQSQAFNLGAELVDRPFGAAGFGSMLGALDRTQLEINQGYALSKLRDISAEAVSRINNLLHRAFMGGKSLLEIQKAIGAELLGGGKVPDIFSAAGKRAAAITHNEIHRMQNMGAQERLKGFAARALDRADRQQPGKEWRHTPAPEMFPRPGHIGAAPVGLNRAVVPVNEPFTSPDTGNELMFPGDGAPEDSIGCKCYLLPAFLPAAA